MTWCDVVMLMGVVIQGVVIQAGVSLAGLSSPFQYLKCTAMMKRQGKYCCHGEGGRGVISCHTSISPHHTSTPSSPYHHLHTTTLHTITCTQPPHHHLHTSPNPMLMDQIQNIYMAININSSSDQVDKGPENYLHIR